MDELWSHIDFDMSDDQVAEQLRQVEIAVETQRTQLADLDESSNDLFVANDVDIDGLEEDLLRSGRYVGQGELSNLLQDWTATDGGKSVVENSVLEIQGTSRMAERISALAERGRRTRSETEQLAAQLRQEVPLFLSLDQELARRDGGVLLNSNHPLVMAAVDVPGHRQARFASLSLTDSLGLVEQGRHLVILAVAKNASRGGDEIWGDAFNLDTGKVSSSAFDLLLAALANGALSDADVDFSAAEASRAAQRLMDRINARHATEQQRRERDREHNKRARQLAIRDQYQRKTSAIERRIAKFTDSGLSDNVIRMHVGQLNAARNAEKAHLARIDAEIDPSIEIEYLAVCVVGVTHEREQLR
jgi:hypothetical protein